MITIQDKWAIIDISHKDLGLRFIKLVDENFRSDYVDMEYSEHIYQFPDTISEVFKKNDLSTLLEIKQLMIDNESLYFRITD